MDKKKKELQEGQEEETLLNPTTVATAVSETVSRHGEGASQMLQAYKGIRVDGEGMTQPFKGRSLKKISTYRVNPNHVEQNLKQQSGFSAELIIEARKNQEHILSGDPTRLRTTDGLGDTNNPTTDLVLVDEHGIPIPEGLLDQVDTTTQVKFMGDAHTLVERLLFDPKWEKYLEKVDGIAIPTEQYEVLIGPKGCGDIWEAWAYVEDVKRQLLEDAERYPRDSSVRQEILDAIDKLEAEQEKYFEIQSKLRDAGASGAEAMAARKNPRLFVLKETAKSAHTAGVEGAKSGLLMGGVISAASNICQVASGEKELPEAIKDTAIATVGSGTVAYGMAAGGSVVKALMHSAGNNVLQKLSTTSFPGMAVSTCVEVTRVLRRYFNRDITGTQAVAQMGEKGVGTLAASYGAAVGTLLLPGIGTAAGGMIGYAVSSMFYKSCLQIMEEADLARANYEEVKAMCEAARVKMAEERKCFEAYAETFFKERKLTIDSSMTVIMDCLDSPDTTDFTQAVGALVASFGKTLKFKGEGEFDQFMKDKSSTLLL